MDAAKLMELMKNKKQSLKTHAKTIKPKPGTNRYVLLQGWRKGEEQVWWHDFGQHFIKDSAGQLQAVYMCLDKTHSQACPICDGIKKASAFTSDDETVALLKEAGAAQTYLINVLALDSDTPTVPQILEVKKTVFSQLIDIVSDWGVTVLDSTSAQIVTITREGTGMNTKYSATITPKHHPVPADALSKLNDLDEYVRQENEDNKRRALSAVNSVVGLLPPGSDTPATVKTVDDTGDIYEEAAARRSAAMSKPSADDISLDDELADLLGEATGT